eukprot:IDg16590t1
MMGLHRRAFARSLASRAGRVGHFCPSADTRAGYGRTVRHIATGHAPAPALIRTPSSAARPPRAERGAGTRACEEGPRRNNAQALYGCAAAPPPDAVHATRV